MNIPLRVWSSRNHRNWTCFAFNVVEKWARERISEEGSQCCWNETWIERSTVGHGTAVEGESRPVRQSRKAVHETTEHYRQTRKTSQLQKYKRSVCFRNTVASHFRNLTHKSSRSHRNFSGRCCLEPRPDITRHTHEELSKRPLGVNRLTITINTAAIAFWQRSNVQRSYLSYWFKIT